METLGRNGNGGVSRQILKNEGSWDISGGLGRRAGDSFGEKVGRYIKHLITHVNGFFYCLNIRPFFGLKKYSDD